MQDRTFVEPKARTPNVMPKISDFALKDTNDVMAKT